MLDKPRLNARPTNAQILEDGQKLNAVLRLHLAL